MSEEEEHMLWWEQGKEDDIQGTQELVLEL